MSEKLVEVETGSSVTLLRLNRPARKNALNLEMLRALQAALEEAGASSARALLLEARGNVFSAGHDFAELLQFEHAELRRVFQVCSEVMLLIRALPQPVIAAVQGPAMGAGAQLALSCDLVVAAENASFQTPGGKAGWFCHTPGVAVGRAVTQKRALEMLLTGDAVSAETAAAWGMINRAVPAERLADESMELALRASRGSRTAKALGKQTFYNQIELDEWHAWQLAAEVMASSAVSEAARETMRAFVEKRKPEFTE